MSYGARLIAIFILVTLCVSAAAAAFEQITVVPILTKPLNGHGIIPLYPVKDEGTINLNELKLGDEPTDNTPLFTVGTSGTSPYLRDRVFSVYDKGMWTYTETPGDAYQGGTIPVYKSGLSFQSQDGLQISPIRSLGVLPPVPKDTILLRSNDPFTLTYFSEYGTFENRDDFNSSYRAECEVQTFRQSVLEKVNASQDGDYLQLPDDIEAQIKQLAEFVTKDAPTAIDKALAIEEFLRGNYHYRLATVAAPTGTDPLVWFLFNSKEGSCAHFNTALALMARSVGIPARLVSGYLILPGYDYQIVTAMNAHAYVEMEFEDVGWLTFDATQAGHDWYRPEETTTPTPTTTYNNSVSGLVFYDLNANQVWDYGDDYANGVPVLLLDSSNRLVRTVTSGENDFTGRFAFSELAPGSYSLQIAIGSDYESSGPRSIPFVIGKNETLTGMQFSIYFKPPVHGLYGTITNITGCEEMMRRGQGFTVTGTVTNMTGDAVSGLTVQIYLSMDKQGMWYFSGEGDVQGGGFAVHCMAPESLLVGTYHVIAKTLGTALFNSSQSDPQITLFDGTEINISMDARVAAGLPVPVKISLTAASDGRPLIFEPVQLYVDGNRSEHYIYNGVCEALVILPTVGMSEVMVKFDGAAYLNSSQTSKQVEVLPVALDCMSNRVVRGEQNVVIGRAHAADLGIGGEPVQLQIERGPTVTGVTDRNGYFTMSFNMTAGATLGPASQTLSLADVIDSSTVNITARPHMDVFMAGTALKVVLRDDQGRAMAGQNVTCDGAGFTAQGTTDGYGMLRFLPSADQAFNYTFIFAGSATYEAASVNLFYSPPPVGYGPIPLYGAAIALPALGVALYLRHRRRARKRSPGAAPKKTYPYHAVYPDIGAGLPGVWHEGEPLRISVGGEFQELTLRLDAEPSVPFRNGDPAMVRSLCKGSHAFRLTGQAGTLEEEIRIVDYREEVTRLFRESIERLRKTTLELGDDMAPREIQAVVQSKLPTGREGALDEMITLFEVADYSPRPIGRREYERMYRAVSEVCG